MGAMAETDRELFREKYEDLKYMEGKVDNNETFGVDVVELTAETKSDLDDLIKQTVRNTIDCPLHPIVIKNLICL